MNTKRLILEPIVEAHSRELVELFKDPELHHFVPFDPLSLEKQQERCQRWSKRISPDGDEIWLNWAARDRITQKVMAHFQAGIRENNVATIGYLVAREFQNRGLATEGLQTVFNFLRTTMKVREIKAWSDSRPHGSGPFPGVLYSQQCQGFS